MMKNEIKWLETEYIRNDITFQPVLVNNRLWYTVFDNHGYSILFETFLQAYKWMDGNGVGDGNCFDTEEEMIKYLEEV